jgi:hypothetical protein
MLRGDNQITIAETGSKADRLASHRTSALALTCPQMLLRDGE